MYEFKRGSRCDHHIREGQGGMAKKGKGKFTHKGQQAVLFSSDLKDEPARGSKYCQNKNFSEFRTACL